MEESTTPTALPTPRRSQNSLNAHHPESFTLSAQPSRDETLADSNKRESKGEGDVEKGLVGLSGKQNNEGAEVDKTSAEVQEHIDETKYLTGSRLFLLFSGLLLSILLVALDQTIVATALPVIASKFDALSQVSWIVSAYFLTQAGFMLTIGQLITIIPTKWVYLTVIFIFEVGSLFCAVAWNMNFLIFGRAVAGVGGSGIMVSILVIISEVTRLEQRPLLFGAFGGVFALASVIGPLLGGVFTDHVSWRWCFYINLPLGALSIVATFLLLDAKAPPELPRHVGKTMVQKLMTVDWIGCLLSLGMITPLLLALQWGGNQYPWNDKIIIICFVLFAIICPLFIFWEWKRGDQALMPLSLYKRITQIGTSAESFFIMFNMILGTYYLPFFYQTKGHTPTKSGLDILPFMLACILTAVLSGVVIDKTGRYWLFLFLGPLISAVGAGLLYTLDVDTSSAKLIGFQILYGVGIGAAMQNTVIAIQSEYAKEQSMIAQATSVLQFFQLMGGVLGIAVAGTVFGNKLVDALQVHAPNLPSEVVYAVRQSVSVIFTLPTETQKQVIIAYVSSLDYVFIVGVPTCVMASLCAFMIKNYNLKELGSGGAHMAVL